MLSVSLWDRAEVWVVGASRAGGSDVVEAKENNWSRSWPLEMPASAFIIPRMLGDVPAGCPMVVTLFVQGPSYSQQKELVFVVGRKSSLQQE